MVIKPCHALAGATNVREDGPTFGATPTAHTDELRHADNTHAIAYAEASAACVLGREGDCVHGT